MLAESINVNPDVEEFDLDDRELEVLKLLSSDQNAYYSFQGLRRRLGLHQETLTRTLKRLEEANAIEHSPDGYKVRGSGNTFSFTVRTGQSNPKPVIEAYLPSQIDVTVLFQKLRGRWFSNFRWLGYSHDGGTLSMSWISEDGRMQLQARISSGKITIAADTYTSQDESEQIAAAYQLFDHITKATEEMAQTITPAPVAN
jgi:DNA-binding transcriptional ArsR family regulator